MKKLEQFLWLDSKDRVSHTKFWSNVGYAVLCYTFTYAVVEGTAADYMLWLLFGIVVVGNRTLKYTMLNKNKDDSNV